MRFPLAILLRHWPQWLGANGGAGAGRPGWSAHRPGRGGRDRHARRRATLLFSSLLLLYLLPVWAFRYPGTQDGPAHLSNAVIVKEYGEPGRRYSQFFALRHQPLPNWTTHALLASLMYLVPPLVAEKLLVSGYVVGFAWAYRYFLLSVGMPWPALAVAGLLFVFNYCFWMGFYNYCLSLALVWVIWGYTVRCRGRLAGQQAAALMCLLLASYFTHLFGLLVSAAGAAWLVLAAGGPGRVRKALWLAAALMPAGLLAAHYLISTGFFASGPDSGLVALWTGLRRQGQLHYLRSDLEELNQRFFASYESVYLPLGALVLFYYELLAAARLLAPEPAGQGSAAECPRWPLWLLATAAALLYLLVPDSIGDHGGFLKARLALLPPLLLLGCLRRRPHRPVRLALEAALYLLVALNLLLVCRYCRAANRDLAEYLAASRTLGGGHVIFTIRGWHYHPTPNPLEHAAGYYCLGSGNICLDNYQATKAHFPVRFRPGVHRGRGDYFSYANRAEVDVIIGWDLSSWTADKFKQTCRTVYHQGRLWIFAPRPTSRGGEEAP